MHVDECQYIFVLSERHVFFVIILVWTIGKLVYNLFDGAHSRVDSEVRLVVPAIEIVTRHRRPVVSYYYSIGVDHRNDFEDNTLTELPSRVGVTKQVLDKALHHKGAIRLSWMDTCPNDHVLFPLVHWHTQLALAIFELLEFDQIVLRWIALNPRSDS